MKETNKVLNEALKDALNKLREKSRLAQEQSQMLIEEFRASDGARDQKEIMNLSQRIAQQVNISYQIMIEISDIQNTIKQNIESKKAHVEQQENRLKKIKDALPPNFAQISEAMNLAAKAAIDLHHVTCQDEDCELIHSKIYLLNIEMEAMGCALQNELIDLLTPDNPGYGTNSSRRKKVFGPGESPTTGYYYNEGSTDILENINSILKTNTVTLNTIASSQEAIMTALITVKNENRPLENKKAILDLVNQNKEMLQAAKKEQDKMNNVLQNILRLHPDNQDILCVVETLKASAENITMLKKYNMTLINMLSNSNSASASSLNMTHTTMFSTDAETLKQKNDVPPTKNPGTIERAPSFNGN